jgi:hypothetical protein
MFVHAAVKPFWPVIFFLPWFIFGAACLLALALQRRRRTAPTERADGLFSKAARRRGSDLNYDRDSSARAPRP